jgi:cyclopropane fatty-acyl-phospholipid synthase-like methyltransferase
MGSLGILRYMEDDRRRRTAGRPEPWDRSYRDGTAAEAWDIGAPQPAIAALADAGLLHSPLLDSGCGTGENSLLLAARGLDVTGVDWAPSAVERARAKAIERGLQATFEVADALALDALGRRFASVIDSGLFHVFEPDEAARYAASLHAVTLPGGTLHLLCFSDREPDWGGPHRISQAQLQSTFAQGWRITSIEPSSFVTATSGGTADAWLATIVRS